MIVIMQEEIYMKNQTEKNRNIDHKDMWEEDIED